MPVDGTARALRRASIAAASIAALRFSFAIYGGGLPLAWTARLDPILDGLALAALAFFANAAFRFASSAPLPNRGTIYRAATFTSLGLGLEVGLWLISRLGSTLGQFVWPAIAAAILWSLGRATLWVGATRALARGWRPLVPTLATIRLLLFGGTLVGPYLESGGALRSFMIESATARNWLAVACVVACDASIAWLASTRAA